MTIIELEKKLDRSGIETNPIITTEEIAQLRDKYKELANYFDYSNNSILFKHFQLLVESMNKLLMERKSNFYAL